MITKVFSVYDSKAKAYGVPFFMPSSGVAVRAFSDLSNDPQSMVFRHANDFVLYEIGSFDDNSGRLTFIVPHIQLGIGADFVEKKPVIFRPAADPVVKAVENPLATASELDQEGTPCNR